MIEDRQLLRDFIDSGSECAFRALVERHLPLTYHVALRQARGNAAIAEEVAQEVFSALAAKARGLRERDSLTGWLYHASRLAALNHIRREQRRIEREQGVYRMQTTERATPSPDWTEAAPVIERALGELGEPDRSAVLLRFYENRSFAEIAGALRTSEDAARMRTARALERLGDALRRGGITSSSAALAGWMATQAVGAAPPALAGMVSTAALAGPAAAGAGTWLASLALMKGIKLGITAFVVAGAVTATLFQARANRSIVRQVAAIRAENERSLQLEHQRQERAKDMVATELSDPKTAELGRIHAEIERLQSRPPGVTDAAFIAASAWMNRGCATPEAAVETLFWASAHHDLDVFEQACYVDERWTALLNQWFSTLSPQVQAEFGTPKRLLANAVGSFLMDASRVGPGTGSMVAYQLTDLREDDSGDTIVSVWKQVASGQEAKEIVKLGPTAAGWGYDVNFRTAADWQRFIFNTIDPNTGRWKGVR